MTAYNGYKGDNQWDNADGAQGLRMLDIRTIINGIILTEHMDTRGIVNEIILLKHVGYFGDNQWHNPIRKAGAPEVY